MVNPLPFVTGGAEILPLPGAQQQPPRQGVQRQTEEEQAEPGQLQQQDLFQRVQEANRESELLGQRIEFSLLQESDQQLVQAQDRQTGELLRTMSAEEFIQLREQREGVSQILFDRFA
jgi:uncharacterized FlaG/YvyC family protein